MSPSKFDLEGRVQTIIKLLRESKLSEDGSVEFKGQWPTDDQIPGWARRIAGLCNASQGHQALWIVGVDEQTKSVVGATARDRAEIFPKLRNCFDQGFMPNVVHDISVPIGDLVVVAILFESDRAPYVVKNPDFGKPNGGKIKYEVPWRDGTSVRSAKREDLIGLLYGRKRAPRIDVLSASVEAREDPETPSHIGLWVEVQAYVSPHPGTVHIWPNHKRAVMLVRGSRPGPIDEFGLHQGELRVSDGTVKVFGNLLGQSPPVIVESKETPLRIRSSEAVLAGPTRIFLKAKLTCTREHLPTKQPLFIRCVLIDAEDEGATTIEVVVSPATNQGKREVVADWSYEAPHLPTSFRGDNAVTRALLLEPELNLLGGGRED